ncbi:DNA topoisomerase (ATP-hydrolyzing) subunit B [Planctomycetota bacterium]
MKKSTEPYNNDKYGASDIKVLKGMEAVRKRPGMYIGDTASYGLHHLVREVVDNSVDEHLAVDEEHPRGICQHIHVILHQDHSVTVEDDGRGIPIGMHPTEGKPALEVALTTLHAGGKFDNKSYKVSGGLHGVGLSVVNALSEHLEVEVYLEGKIYRQTYQRGEKTGELKITGETEKTGTKIRFTPDREIFSEYKFKYEILTRRMRDLAFLNAGLTLKIDDEIQKRSDSYEYEGGIQEFVKFINRNKEVLHKEIIHLYSLDRDGRADLEVAFQYNDGYNENVMTYANNINTPDGGTHLVGFKTALTRAVNNFARKNNMLKNNAEPPTGDDLREGLSAVVSVKMLDPQFEGQTKTKLGNSDIQKKVETLVYEQLMNTYEETPGIAKAIFNKGLQARQARLAAKKAKELARRKGALHSGSLPGKLADCSSREVENTEIYVVEGDSAGGSAKQGRDRRFQAILPLKGKILNVEKARLDKMLNHEEIQTLITALGTGIGKDDFDCGKLRYGKVIIMTDADVDGSHIRTLLLTFFFRHMTELIEQGNIYIAQPPLYKVTRKKKSEYVHSDIDMRRTLVKLGMQEVTLRIIKSGVEFSGEKLASLVKAMEELEVFGPSIRRHGLHFDRYLNMRNDDGQLPIARVIFTDSEELCYSEMELNGVIEQFRQQHQREPVIWESGNDFSESDKSDLKLYRIPEAQELAVLLDRLEELGIEMGLFSSDLKDRFELVFDNENKMISSIIDILPAFRDVGSQGMEIQRYKGLGEMNPQQLWETTMDPEKRTLLRVTLPDAAHSDWLFNVLMGSMVEARRDYINKHALEVRNIDLV